MAVSQGAARSHTAQHQQTSGEFALKNLRQPEAKVRV
jgi:hypothetical protein